MVAKSLLQFKRAEPFIRLAATLLIAVVLAAGAVGNQAVLNRVMHRRYLAISTQHPLGNLAQYPSDELRAYIDRSPADLAGDKNVDLRDLFVFFARAGQRKKATQTARAIPSANRPDYAFTLYNVVAYFAELGDLAATREEAQRLINVVGKLGPVSKIFDINTRLDSCRKLVRLLNRHYPLSDPTIIDKMLRPGQLTTGKYFRFAHFADLDDTETSESVEVTPKDEPPDLRNYGDYYAVAAKAKEAGPGAQARDLWAGFVNDHPDSELREDAEINILSIRVYEARHAKPNELHERAQAVIADALTFADVHNSALTDDALLYALRACATISDQECAWATFTRLSAMRGSPDSALKARYLVMHANSIPQEAPEEDRALLDAFTLRTVGAGDQATVSDIAGLTANGEKTLTLLALVTRSPRAVIASAPATNTAKLILCNALRWGIEDE